MNKYLLGTQVIAYVDNRTLYHNLINCKEVGNHKDLRKLMTINQLVSEIHVIGTQINHVADYLSRAEMRASVIRVCNLHLGSMVDYRKIAVEQTKDEWCSSLQHSDSYQRLFKEHGSTSYQFWIHIMPNKQHLICLPKSCIRMVIAAFHDLHHPGREGTHRMVSNRFFWPQMHKHIQSFVKSCLKCQQMKHSRLSVLPITSISQPDGRFKTNHMDIVGPMTYADGEFQYVLSIRDRFTGYLVLAPLISQEATHTFDVFVARYIGTFGLPTLLITDNGSNFKEATVEYFHRRLGVHHATTTPYHPQCNAFVENPNRRIKASMRCISPAKWATNLPIIQLAWNNTSCSSLHTPAQMVFGANQTLPADLFNVPQKDAMWNDENVSRYNLLIFICLSLFVV